jgi:predicted SprT family Zn-dependent metalloprotease
MNIRAHTTGGRMAINSEPPASPAVEVTVGDTVNFQYRAQTLTGLVIHKERNRAVVACDREGRFRVPYIALAVTPDVPRRSVPIIPTSVRANCHSGDRVRFETNGCIIAGTIARLNTRRAHVVADDGREYGVSYALLKPVEGSGTATSARSAADLEAIAGEAQTLMARHNLAGWGFQFDYSTKRAGSCRFNTRVITLSVEFAQRASHEEVTDTILHEIAHALVGPAHDHDQAWRRTAVEIGCSGRRCHDVRFSAPRYIVRCLKGCWLQTAERRMRGARCARCLGPVAYSTYTPERLAQCQAGVPRRTDGG